MEKATGLAGRSLKCCSGDGAVTWRHQEALASSVIRLRPFLAVVPEAQSSDPSFFGADGSRGSSHWDASLSSA